MGRKGRAGEKERKKKVKEWGKRSREGEEDQRRKMRRRKGNERRKRWGKGRRK